MDDNTEGPDLPLGIARAWGIEQRPRRGPKPGLSLKVIVERAIELADAEGLGALSMSRLAADLGFTTMSLYRYVGSKDELLVLIANAAIGQPPALSGSDWRDRLKNWTRAQLAVLRAHPWMIMIPISGPPLNPNSVVWMERCLQALRGSGLDEGDKMGVLQLLSGYVLSQARIEIEITQAYAAEGSDPMSVARDYGRALAGLIDAQRFPALSAVLSAQVFEGGGEAEDWDVDVEFGLDRILDGIAVLIEARQAPPFTAR